MAQALEREQKFGGLAQIGSAKAFFPLKCVRKPPHWPAVFRRKKVSHSVVGVWLRLPNICSPCKLFLPSAPAHFSDGLRRINSSRGGFITGNTFWIPKSFWNEPGQSYKCTKRRWNCFEKGFVESVWVRRHPFRLASWSKNQDLLNPISLCMWLHVISGKV